MDISDFAVALTGEDKELFRSLEDGLHRHERMSVVGRPYRGLAPVKCAQTDYSQRLFLDYKKCMSVADAFALSMPLLNSLLLDPKAIRSVSQALSDAAVEAKRCMTRLNDLRAHLWLT